MPSKDEARAMPAPPIRVIDALPVALALLRP